MYHWLFIKKVIYYNRQGDKPSKKGKEQIKMKYLFSCDFYFEITADNYDEAIKKGWDFIHSNLPESFSVEGAELFVEDESEI